MDDAARRAKAIVENCRHNAPAFDDVPVACDPCIAAALRELETKRDAALQKDHAVWHVPYEGGHHFTCTVCKVQLNQKEIRQNWKRNGEIECPPCFDAFNAAQTPDATEKRCPSCKRRYTRIVFSEGAGWVCNNCEPKTPDATSTCASHSPLGETCERPHGHPGYHRGGGAEWGSGS